jgi:hypothetical protein
MESGGTCSVAAGQGFFAPARRPLTCVVFVTLGPARAYRYPGRFLRYSD